MKEGLVISSAKVLESTRKPAFRLPKVSASKKSRKVINEISIGEATRIPLVNLSGCGGS